MTGDKKLIGSWYVVAGTATESMMVVAWLGISSGPTQGGGGAVQCGQREKKALTFLTSSDGRQLCSKAAMTNNGRWRDGVALGWRRRWRLEPTRSASTLFNGGRCHLLDCTWCTTCPAASDR
jgi:hypothetical protein